MKVYIFTFLLLVFSLFLNAQNDNYKHEGHEHEERHNHNGFELGLGTGAFYMINETEWATGAHLHALYSISKFGFGLGFESVFAEIQHYGLGVIFAYRPIENLEFSLSPGILLDNEETVGNQFAMHIEAIYSWEIESFGHLGPVVGYGFAGHDKHLMLGLHLGIDL